MIKNALSLYTVVSHQIYYDSNRFDRMNLYILGVIKKIEMDGYYMKVVMKLNDLGRSGLLLLWQNIQFVEVSLDVAVSYSLTILNT